MTDPSEADGQPPAPVRRILPPWRTAVLLGLLVAIAFVVRIDALRNSALDVPVLGDAKAYEMTGWFLAEDHVLVRPYEYGDARLLRGVFLQLH